MRGSTEIKLEVGKKYNLSSVYPENLIQNKTCKLIYENNKYYFFETEDENVHGIDKRVFRLEYKITEHREMIKNDFTGWVNYYSNKNGFDVFCHDSKEYADAALIDSIRGKSIYAKITFEQLPEPEET